MVYPATPDGRYFVVRGRLWRMTNPALTTDERERLMGELGRARAALRRSAHAPEAERRRARRQVQAAKVGLGERGPVWWTDDAPDYNRHMAVNTPYREWYQGLKLAV
ncbi:Putative uncharacterized protein OS=Synechococcus sp. PCC 7335 GN=S7335_2242 PE=4 SV=1 [Gemmata massiliana]|uniref:Uncharacterized protein n=1 Tax=Gemmata massiliana TaxID=1210884 RepID=A0A6P2CXM6_9BACT|nr:hypothetical protein [Gemmata massiliana]VTR93126.1 Putative uncharacterized protein OS=Synechococcus sp. PCC 7335 GN=S7335_2242 PE=4 SV=1 [Gemmata massiliana]